MVYPTDKLSDNDFLRSFDTLHAVAKPAFLVPQGVLVVHTEAASQGAAAQLLEAIEGRREIVVPWPDGTQVAVLLSDMPFPEEGLREFLEKHLPASEDCRFVEINFYRPIVVLKASAASIDAFRRALRRPTTAPTTRPTRAEGGVGAARPVTEHRAGSR